MFKFKNKTSTEMKVIVEEETEFLAKAPQKTEIIEIDGRDGAIFNELGYGVVERPIKIQILDDTKFDDILGWLNGEGTFEYNNRVTTARFYNEIEPKREANIKVASFNFIRDPFWYKATDNYVTVTTKVTNEGNIASRPIIKLEKGEDESIDVTIGGVRFTYTFLTDDTYVEIDCEEMTATYNGLLRNRQLSIGYNFPLLPVGESTVTIHSGDATVKVKKKDRWL
jgi:phage-related protein